MASYTSFANEFFTRFSPIDPFEIELEEATAIPPIGLEGHFTAAISRGLPPGRSRGWRSPEFDNLTDEHVYSIAAQKRDVLQIEIRKFDGNGPGRGEMQNKMALFTNIHPSVQLEEPETEQNFRFGPGWPVLLYPCGHVL